MTEGIWGKISQLNAGEMPLPRLLLLHGSCGTLSPDDFRLPVLPKFLIFFFLQWLMVLKQQGRYKSGTEDMNAGDDQRRDFGNWQG